MSGHNQTHLFNHQSVILLNTWRRAFRRCICSLSGGGCGFVLLFTWGNISLHRLAKLFLKGTFIHYFAHAMKTWLFWEMSIFLTFLSSVCQILVDQPWCLCFYWFLPLHLCFSTYCSPSESDCESEPAQTLAPEMRRFFYIPFWYCDITPNDCSNRRVYCSNSDINLPASVFGWDQQWLCLQPEQLWTSPVPAWC